MPRSVPTQLGNTLPQNLPAPQQVGTSSWNAVSASNSFTTAIRSDGLLHAWGLNSVNQLGDATTVARSFPLQISNESFILR